MSAALASLLASQLLSLQTAANSIANADQPIVAIENVSVVDVERGQIAEPRSVLIADGRISAVGEPNAVTIPAAAIRVDGQGDYLIPGLVDMHVHLFNNATRRPPNDWTFPLFVTNGVTAVREMAAAPADIPLIKRWRAAVDRGQLIAPRVLAAGIPVRADSADAARRLVREARAAGTDFIKVFSNIRELEWSALLDEARKETLPVCGHVPAAVSALAAAKAGQRSNEHLTQIYEACSKKEKEFLTERQGTNGNEAVARRDAQEREVLADFDPVVCAEIARELARAGQAQVPTLVLPHFEARGDRKKFSDDPRWQSLRADEQARWIRYLKEEDAGDQRLAAARRRVSLAIVRALHRAGAPVLAGTDAPMPLVYPGFSLHKELELLVESGLSPAEALRAATIGPAKFLGLSESTGSVAVGKRADLVLLDENPLRAISNTQRIRAVVLNGRLLGRAELDDLLRPSFPLKKNHDTNDQRFR